MIKRKVYLDQLRVLAIISIVCCHVCCDFIIQNPDIFSHFKTFYMLSFFTLGRFIGIPIFVMISGALLINKSYSLINFIKKRFNRVFVPYMFWAIIFILFTIFIFNEKFTLDLILQVILGHKGTVGVILWFIWMIIIVYIGIFIINKILEYANSKSTKFKQKIINSLIVISLLIYILYNFGFVSSSNEITYYLLFIPYAIIGYGIDNINFTTSKLTPNILTVLTLVIALLGYLYFVWIVDINTLLQNKFSPGSYFQFIVMIIVVSIFLFFRYLSETNFKDNKFLSSNLVSSVILSISKCSFGIYFIHYLLLKFLQKVYLKQLGLFDHPVFWSPILLIGIFFGSWFIIRILENIPVINKLLGVS